jgi:hypothetical protein
MDGACFLYSVANAAKALTRNKNVSPQRWTDMLQTIKRAGDFMDQQIGTENCDSRPQHQNTMVSRMMAALAPTDGITVSLVADEHLTGRRLAALIDPETVLVVGTLDHWVCAVDVDEEGRNLLVADSSQLHEVGGYVEQGAGQFGRISNNTWSAAPQKRYYRAFRIGVATAERPGQ